MEGGLPLLSKTFELYREHFKKLIGYAALILVPYAFYLVLVIIKPELIQAFMMEDPVAMAEIGGGWWLAMVIYGLAVMVVSLWVTVALFQYIEKASKKEKADAEKIKERSWQLLVPLLWVVILGTLIVVAGLFVLVIPGIIFAIYLAYAEVSVVLDNKRGTKALSHSYELIKGRFWKTLWRLIVGPIIILLLYFIIAGILAAVVMGINAAMGGTLDAPTLTAMMALDVIDQLLGVVFMPLFMVYLILLYRNAKATR